MYKLSENKLTDFLYTGSQLMTKEGNTFKYVTKLKELYQFYDIANEEEVYFTLSEVKNLYGIEPLYYFCEFAAGENTLNCNEWQAVEGQQYMQLDAWEAVCGACDGLEGDNMSEAEKDKFMLKLWRTDNILVGIFGIDEIKEICCGNYEPWKEL